MTIQTVLSSVCMVRSDANIPKYTEARLLGTGHQVEMSQGRLYAGAQTLSKSHVGQPI